MVDGFLAILLAGAFCWVFFAPPKAKVKDGAWPIRPCRPVSDLERDFMARVQAQMPDFLVLPCPRFSEFVAVRTDVKGRLHFERRLMERRASLLVCDRFYDPQGVILIEQESKALKEQAIVDCRAIMAAAGLKWLHYPASALPSPEVVAAEFMPVKAS